MATQRTARVIAAENVGADTRLLELLSDAPLGFAGGQYLILDSGLVAPGGKAVKRAYSLLSPDADQRRFQLAVKRLPGGACSGYLHDLPIGAEVRFSGPWGKLLPREGAAGPSLVLATDTGVTAALGLVRSGGFAALRAGCTFVWLRPGRDYFLPDAFVRAALPPGLREARVDALPDVGHPERITICRQLLSAVHARAPLGQAFLAGDGAVNYALLDDLVARGVAANRDSVESFFNMPKKAAASGAA